ncbi:hypothetical protein ES703_106991 [subsurface metagenome]
MKAKYPHMLPAEVRRWDAFLERYGMPEGAVSYDVHLGKGAPIDPDWPAWMAAMVKVLSTHRVDVVVERPDEVVIVEVKGIAGMGAVGQLVGYEALWVKERGVDRPVRLLLVCERVEADMLSVFAWYEIEVVEMGEVA